MSQAPLGFFDHLLQFEQGVNEALDLDLISPEENELFSFVRPVLSGVQDVANNVESAITSVINGFDFDVGRIFDGITDAIVGGFSETATGIETLGTSLYQEIAGYIDREYDQISTNLENVTLGAVGEAKSAAESAESLISGLDETILGYLAETGSAITGAVTTAQTEIEEFIGPPLTFLQETTDNVVEQATGFATALRESIPEIGSAIADGMESLGDKITSGFGDAFDTALSGLGLGFIRPFFDQLKDIDPTVVADIFGSPPREDYVGADLAEYLLRNWAVHLLPAVPLLGSVAQIVFTGNYEITRQLSSGFNKSTILSPGEYARGLMRQDAFFDAVSNKIYRTGLDDQDFELLQNLQLSKPDIGSLVRWRSRGFIGAAEYVQLAGQVGWDEERAETFWNEYYGPPPVGDLIQMVVRDTFEPDVVREGQLSSGFDQFPVEIAEQVGITPYWAEKYWQAHWTLPSMQQGFEMLHRLDWSDERLTALFKAADLAPGYWADLKAISYAPFTRVDVRRMYQTGVLDRAGVVRSYKDIGYDAEKAELLTEFTVRYVEGTKKVVKEKERDLSKTDVIGLFNDGVITPDEARVYLMELGYSNDEAEVLVLREQIQEERRERKDEIGTIINEAKVKALTYEQAQDRLAALDLSPTESRKASASLTRATTERTRAPTKADLDTWLELGLLTEAEYELEMGALGYPERYIALYLEAMQVESEEDLLAAETRAAGRREARPVTKGQLDSLYIGEIILEDEYVAGLQALGYRANDVENFLTAANVRLDEKLAAERERLARGELAPPKERLPNRTLLGKMYLKGLITLDGYVEGLTRLGFSPDNVELLRRMISAKRASEDNEV